REELPTVAVLPKDHRAHRQACSYSRGRSRAEQRPLDSLRTRHQPRGRDHERCERPRQQQPEQFPVAAAVVLIPDLVRPKQEAERREQNAENRERPRHSTLETRDADDRRRARDERRRERGEDLSFGVAEVAVDDCRDGDERGDRDDRRRAQQEDAPERHRPYALVVSRSFTAERAFSRMNRSVASNASSSATCVGGDFMRYELGPSSAPATPLFSASFARRTASMTIPAEFGESQTSSLSSMFSGTSPKDEPSMRMYAHLRSVSHGT